MSKLTISLVNYNYGKYLLECLESIEKVKDEAEIEVWVVDNASADDSIKNIKSKKFKIKIHLILNRQNVGFGRAHNQVLERIKDDYILLLNPDTYLEQGVLKTMLEFMEENREVGASTCKVIQADGQLDWATHRGFPTPWASFKYFFLKNDSSYHLSNQDLGKIHEVDAISGAFFLTKAEVLQKVGFFDEDYFIYAEDIDLSFRIKQAGFKIIYNPKVQILHHKGVATGLKKHSLAISTASLETRQKMTKYFYQTMKLFYQKHLAKRYPFFINWLVYLGIDLKYWLAKRKLVV